MAKSDDDKKGLAIVRQVETRLFWVAAFLVRARGNRSSSAAKAADEALNEYPITDWEHRVDLSHNHFMKLIAVRRDKPFDSVTYYIIAGDSKLYLHEIGMDC